jgi:hypothetical protein
LNEIKKLEGEGLSLRPGRFIKSFEKTGALEGRGRPVGG